VRLGSSIRRRREATGPARTRFPGRMAMGVLLVAAVGLGSGYFLATRVLFPAPAPPGDLVPVPDLRGSTLDEAARALEEAGLVLDGVDTLRHPTEPPGAILGQSPLPGQLALVGGSVRVAVSDGPDLQAVPEVVRLRADRARTILEATGFRVVEDSVESETPRGTVVGLEPPPGTEAALPSEVRVLVSQGPPLVEMPLLLGLREEEAAALVDSLGLALSEVETRFRFGRDVGIVVEQEPAAGELVEKGTAVRIVVGSRTGGEGVLPREQSAAGIVEEQRRPRRRSPSRR